MLAPCEYERGATAGYLDTATYGLPPRSTVRALEAAVADWRDRQPWQRWEDDGEACRALFARIVGARPEDVALVPSVSAAAGIVAASLPVDPAANVVAYEDEFTSNLFPWLALEERGVEVRLRPLAELAGAVDERTALVAVSAVQSADGAVADVSALARTGARVFVDGTHAIGALRLPLGEIDYLAVAPYKWLLCPRGLSFLYVRPERLAEVDSWGAGWKSACRDDPGYYGPPRLLYATARRLDSSLPWLLAAGARASLEVVDGIGVERIAEHDLALARRFASALDLPEPAAPIVPLDVGDGAATVERLRAAGIACAVRGDSIRFSFHLYNDEEDVDRAVSFLSQHASRARAAEHSRR